MNVQIRHDMTFVAGIYYNDQLRMNNYNLRLWMLTNTHDVESHNVAFERVRWFVYNELNSTIFINSEIQSQCQKFINAGCKITTMPGEPVDQLIGIMLYYKLNAIMEDRILVVETELSSSLGENIVYIHNEAESSSLSYFPTWWQTADLTHCDTNLLESDKVLTMQNVNVWKNLNLAWEFEEPVQDQDATVVFADFKKNNETK